jgi:catechol 2,3-dioxygenase-like lactoylglutathione lyase family enzyme
MSISHVQLFSVPVSDQDRAREFYTKTLGFEVVSEAETGPDMRWMQVRTVGTATSLTLVTWFPSMPAGTLKGTVFETDALEEDVASLREKGVRTSEIEAEPWGRFVTFDDPDGNGIVLQETTSQPR